MFQLVILWRVHPSKQVDIQKTDSEMKRVVLSRPESYLRNTILDMFIAGSDTITTTLNWAMLYMILYPDIQKKVREELNANIGSRNTKMSDRNQTPYTEAVLHEIHRKGSIAATSIFHNSTQLLSAGDYQICKDTLIIPMLRKIMHDPEYFHEPDRFDPERYLSIQDDGTLKS